MGYQESFITPTCKKNFIKFKKRIKELGTEYYNYYHAFPRYVVYVKKNIYGQKIELDNIVIANDSKKIILHSNTSYVYFTGERFLQSRANRIINVKDKYDENWTGKNDFTKKRLENCPFSLKAIFSEEIDCSKIFDNAKHKDGIIYCGLDNEWINVTEFKFSS